MSCKYDPMTVRRAIDSVIRRGAAALSSIESVLMDKRSDRGHDHPRQDARCKCVIVEGDDGNHMEAMHPNVDRDEWCPLVAHRNDSLRLRRQKRAAEAALKATGTSTK